MHKGRKPESELKANKGKESEQQTHTNKLVSVQVEAEKKLRIEQLLAEIEAQLNAASLPSDTVKELRDLLD